MVDHTSDGPDSAAGSATTAAIGGAPSPGRPWRSIVADSGLPAATQSLIRRVVRAAGGTSRERRETATELVSHFAEAIEAGTPVESAIRAFGPERTAAKLLRRAIRRKRGHLWHAWWWSSRAALAGVACCLAVYAWWTVRLLSARPTIRVDYIAQLEALAASTRASESGWPLLRDAYAEIRKREKPLLDRYEAIDPTSGIAPLECLDPTSPLWRADEEALAGLDAEIQQVREASRRPTVAPRFNRFDEADQRFYGDPIPSLGPLEPAHDLRLPHLLPIRAATRWLTADARHAFQRGDHERALDDVRTILRIAPGLHGCFLVEQLVAHAIAARGFQLAAWLADRAMAHETMPERERFLATLAGLVESVDLAGLRIQAEGERLSFEDALQRYFTDDGQGDGRVTRAGLQAAALLDDGALVVFAPAMMALAPSRSELHERLQRRFLHIERLSSLPPWQWADEFGPDALAEAETPDLAPFISPLGASFWLPHVLPVAAAMAQLEAQRTQARLGIALCRYRAERGAWPERLDALVPAFIASLPLDPFDGMPVRYAIRGGVPTAWVVGIDATDQSLPPGSERADDAAWSTRFRSVFERRRAAHEPRATTRDAGAATGRPDGVPDDIQIWPLAPAARSTPVGPAAHFGT